MSLGCSLLLSLSVALSLVSGQANAESDRLAKLKAAFIFNVLKFIEWPEDTPSSPLEIAFPDDGELKRVLLQATQGKSIKGRALVITDKITPQTDVIYLSSTAPTKTKAPILILHADPKTVGKGAAIGLGVEDNKIRLTISRKALEKQRLKASSQLLKLARLVE